MTLLCTAMLASVMYYDNATLYSRGSDSTTFGPFVLDYNQAYVGAVVAFLCMPFVLFCVHIFRKARQRVKLPNHVRVALARANHAFLVSFLQH